MNYYLLNNDCLKVLPTLKDKQVDLVVTSPPYYHVKKYSGVQGELDEGTVSSYSTKLYTLFKEFNRILKDNGVLCLNIDNGKRNEDGSYTISSWDIATLEGATNLKLINTIIWYDKVRRPSSSDYLLSHKYEPIFIFAKSKNITFNKDLLEPKYRQDVWELNYSSSISQALYDRSGIATFPVSLTDNLIKLYSNERDTVLEPFMGSGTTLESCIRLKRNFIGTEISKEYFNNCVNRAKQFIHIDDSLKVF